MADSHAPYVPKRPQHLGLTVFDDVPLTTLRDYIDWTPFFLSWELRGKYPAIFDDAVVGSEAKKIFAEANVILDRIVAERSLRAKAVCGLFPANAADDDNVELYADDSRTTLLTTLNFLRQQSQKASGQQNLCLADFVAPEDAGVPDYVGAFVVTAGIGAEELCKHYEAQNDDYSSIMVKAIADRLAEAAAEWLHERVRRELWGYAADESLDNESLIKETYVGIRPAPGYPACPEHSEKRKLFDLLSAEANTGVVLTESYAMYPAASVSGWYFAHPEAKYFPLGKIARDQVQDYAERKGWTLEEAERWLAPVLAYG
jgi:5-methyltetrahydrofolate--homocysteine methyltransferase